MLNRFFSKIFKSRPTELIKINLGDFRSITPLFDNGIVSEYTQIDEFYINKFISSHKNKLKGNFLFSGRSNYLDTINSVKGINIQNLDFVNEQSFLSGLDKFSHVQLDGILLIQILNFIYDVDYVLKTCHHLLKPGGVLYAVVPGTVYRFGKTTPSAYRNFTKISLHKLLEKNFSPKNIQLKTYGNVLSATAFIHSIPADELSIKELNFTDQQYPLIITVKAVKS